MFRDLYDALYHFLKNRGLNPLIVFVGVAIIVYILSYRKDIKKWESLASKDKVLIIIQGIGLLIGITICILYIIND